MSTIIQQPDSLNLVGNLKKFIISADAEVVFTLQQGDTVILNEKYQPDINGQISIDIRAIIDRLLDVSIPTTNNDVSEQLAGFGDFVATVDGTEVDFRVVKGGVAELGDITADTWLAAHWLTWQVQEKFILQQAPEWLGIYTISEGEVIIVVYFADGTSNSDVYNYLDPDILYSINTSWGNIAAWVAANAFSDLQPIAWDVYYQVDGTRMTPVQRYQLRNSGDEEHLYVWKNTLGGIDLVSFTGYQEEDQKLTHQTALENYDEETISEYDIQKDREIRQSTGYLNPDEELWLKDFFYSRGKFMVRPDGSIKQISVISSKIVSSSLDDECDYEFTFRMGTDGQLLNLDRTNTELPAPEGLADFFLTDLLSGLTEASYVDNLILAVQSPYAIGWQKISMSQLWGGALPTLIDGVTIKLINGKLTAISTVINNGGGSDSGGGTTPTDSRTELIDGAIIWRSGLTYDSTVIDYKILGVQYSANAKTLTLQPSDPTYDRIDLFYVDQFSQLQVMTGTPSSNPATPIQNAKQLEVMSVLIEAGALEPANVDIEKVYDENVEWVTSSETDDNTIVDFASTDNPLNGAVRIKVGIAIPDSVVSHPLHTIGEAYQGGIIFWLSADGTQGLIVSKEDVAVGVFYESLSGGSPYATGANGVNIGTGQANTVLLLANARAAGNAVKYCDQLIVDGYDDWYMPSELELAEIYFRRMEIGGLSTLTRWSSTEVTGSNDWKRARCISFSDGTIYTRDKNNNYAVRAIRYFDDSLLPTGMPIATYAPDTLTVTFTAPAPVIVKDGILSLNLKSTLPWIANSSVLLIELFLGVNRIGTVAMGVATNIFGYKPGEDNWQLVAIQIYNFAPDDTKLDAIKISLMGSWPNNLDLGFDDIRYQHSTIEGSAALLLAVDRTDFNFKEIPDGTLMVFTTLYPYIADSTKMSLNGVRQTKGDNQQFMEWNDQIYFFYPPEANSAFVIDYKTLHKD